MESGETATGTTAVDEVAGVVRLRMRLFTSEGMDGPGSAWMLELQGLDVPLSLDSDYYYFEARRKVFVAMYWEDGDRDDADGPNSSIK